MTKNNNERKSYITAITLALSVASIYITLVAHASSTSFKSGYLAYFGIDIRNVDFWPTIADLMNEPLLVIGSILILLIVCLLAIMIINGLYGVFRKLAEWGKWKKLLNFFDEKPYSKGFSLGVLIAVLAFLSFKIPLYDSRDRGVEAAKEQTSFAVVVSESPEKQVLVYQYGDTGLFKIYNAETKSFSGAYEQLNMSGLKLQQVKLIED